MSVSDPLQPPTDLHIETGVKLDVQLTTSNIANIPVTKYKLDLIRQKRAIDAEFAKERDALEEAANKLQEQAKALAASQEKESATQLSKAMEAFVGQKYLTTSTLKGADTATARVSFEVEVISEKDQLEEKEKQYHSNKYPSVAQTFVLDFTDEMKQGVALVDKITERMTELKRRLTGISAAMTDLPLVREVAENEVTMAALSGKLTDRASLLQLAEGAIGPVKQLTAQ